MTKRLPWLSQRGETTTVGVAPRQVRSGQDEASTRESEEDGREDSARTKVKQSVYQKK